MASNIVFTAEKTEISEQQSFSIRRTGWDTWDATLPWDSLSDCIMTITAAFSTPAGQTARGTLYQVHNNSGNYRPMSQLQWLDTNGSEYILSVHTDELVVLASVLTDLADFEGVALDLDMNEMEWRHFEANVRKVLGEEGLNGLEPRVTSLEGAVTSLDVRTDALEAGAVGLDARVDSLEDLTNIGRLSDASLDASYADKSVQAVIETGRLSPTTLDTTINTEISDYDKSIRAKFDLSKARVNFGTTFGPTDRLFMQSAFVSEADNNRWYISSNATGSDVGRETTVVRRLTYTGASESVMTFIDAGHGDGIFVEVSGGVSYVWVYFTDWNYAAGNPLRYNYIRMPWTPGTYTYADVASYRVPGASGVAHILGLDEYNGVINSRRGSGTTRTLSAYNLADIKSSPSVPTPISTCVATIPVGQAGVQSHTYMRETDTFYIIAGTMNVDPHLIVGYAGATGAEVSRKTVQDLYKYDAWGAVNSTYEPEGIFVHHTPSGFPSLIFGAVTGREYARSKRVYSVDMGERDGVFNFEGAKFPSDAGAWVSTAFTPASGFTSSATDPFEMKVENNKLLLRGKLEGSFTSGTTVLGNVATALRPPSARQSVAVLQGSGGITRVELSAAGNLSLILSSAITGTFTFLDFDPTWYWLTKTP